VKRIDITIKDGVVDVRTSGYTGGDCYKDTAELERAMGRPIKGGRTAEGLKQDAATQKMRG
jgi:hypothetical protein